MNVIITGASKGIGYAMAKRLTEIQDVRLYLIARSEKLLLQLKKDCLELNPDAEIVTVPFDMTNLLKNEWPENIDCKHIDILINNAGLLLNKNFENLNTDEIIGMATVNFVAPSLLIQKSLSKMGGEHPTHIINISSMGSYQGSVKFPGLSIYSASKAALSVLTECLSVELKEKNIFVNSLALGAVQTEMLRAAFPDYQAPLSPDEMAEFIVDFAINGYKYFNGKILPVSLSTP
ncbi:MAG: SDR family oxidoreductase [Bacteroidales bacterium]|nr:SDR family oxidoreductase [Bacteroidales bacterium]